MELGCREERWHYHSHSSTTCDSNDNRPEPTGPLSHSLKGVYIARTTDQPFDNGDSILCTPLQFVQGISTVGINGANCIKVFWKLLRQHKGIVVGNVLGREIKRMSQMISLQFSTFEKSVLPMLCQVCFVGHLSRRIHRMQEDRTCRGGSHARIVEQGKKRKEEGRR